MTGILLGDVFHVRGVDLLIFSQLEDDVIERKAVFTGRGEGAPDAGGGTIYRAGHEVHGELGPAIRYPQLGCQGDGLDAAGLIEGVAVFRGHQRKHLAGGCAVHAAYKGLVGVDLQRSHVDDGLEGHGEFNRKAALAFAACMA